MNLTDNTYGIEDSSYQAAGKLAGITQLVEEFYRIMGENPEFETIYKMHARPTNDSIQRLAYFLSGWLGGPRIYSSTFGGIHIPGAHSHLAIGTDERDAWINCMQQAVDLQPYEVSLKTYLIQQLRVPAERIKQVCSHHQTSA